MPINSQLLGNVNPQRTEQPRKGRMDSDSVGLAGVASGRDGGISNWTQSFGEDRNSRSLDSHCAGNISKHIAMWFSFAIFTRNYNEPEDIPSMHSLPSFGFDDVNMNIYSNYDVTIWLCITMAVGFHRTEKNLTHWNFWNLACLIPWHRG